MRWGCDVGELGCRGSVGRKVGGGFALGRRGGWKDAVNAGINKNSSKFGSMAPPLRPPSWRWPQSQQEAQNAIAMPAIAKPRLPRPSDMIPFAKVASPAVSSIAESQEKPDVSTMDVDALSALSEVSDEKNNMSVCTEASDAHEGLRWHPNLTTMTKDNWDEI